MASRACYPWPKAVSMGSDTVHPGRGDPEARRTFVIKLVSTSLTAVVSSLGG